MNKKVLGVAMVVVFCITWWLVAGEAWKTSIQVEQASQQIPKAFQAVDQAVKAVEQARKAATDSPQYVQRVQAGKAMEKAEGLAMTAYFAAGGHSVKAEGAHADFSKTLEQAVQESPQAMQAREAFEQARNDLPPYFRPHCMTVFPLRKDLA